MLKQIDFTKLAIFVSNVFLARNNQKEFNAKEVPVEPERPQFFESQEQYEAYAKAHNVYDRLMTEYQQMSANILKAVDEAEEALCRYLGQENSGQAFVITMGGGNKVRLLAQFELDESPQDFYTEIYGLTLEEIEPEKPSLDLALKQKLIEVNVIEDPIMGLEETSADRLARVGYERGQRAYVKDQEVRVALELEDYDPVLGEYYLVDSVDKYDSNGEPVKASVWVKEGEFEVE